MLTEFRRRSPAAARLLACCLACALAFCGFASVRTALLGTTHVHRDAATSAALAMAGWQDFRRAAHVGGSAHQPAHQHARFERHRHAPGDASVASLEADGHTPLAGDAGSAGVPVIGLLPADAFPELPWRPDTRARWASHTSRGIERIEAGRLERPPRG